MTTSSATTAIETAKTQISPNSADINDSTALVDEKNVENNKEKDGAPLVAPSPTVSSGQTQLESPMAGSPSSAASSPVVEHSPPLSTMQQVTIQVCQANCLI